MAPSAWRRISIEKKNIFLWSNAGASADAPALHFHWGSFLEGEGTDYVLRPLFSKSSDDFFPPFFSKAALTADFGQNSPGFGQSA